MARLRRVPFEQAPPLLVRLTPGGRLNLATIPALAGAVWASRRLLTTPSRLRSSATRSKASPLHQRLQTKITAVERKQVERPQAESGRPGPTHMESGEVWTAVCIAGDHLAIPCCAVVDVTNVRCKQGSRSSGKGAHYRIRLTPSRRRHLSGRKAYRLSNPEFVRSHMRLVRIEPPGSSTS